jgi:hypothetical protein
MPEYCLLRETPDGSGSYVDTGERLEGDATEILAACGSRIAQSGSRHAVFPYEPLRPVQQAAPPTAPAPSVAQAEPPEQARVAVPQQPEPAQVAADHD